MPPEPEPAVDAGAGHTSLVALALLGPVVGAAAGTVGAIFRLSLGQADRMRDALIGAAHGYKLAGFLGTCGMRNRHRPGGLARSAVLATRVRERNPARRGRAEWGLETSVDRLGSG